MTRINTFMILILHAFLGLTSFAMPAFEESAAPVGLSVDDVSVRSADTCADPSLARTVFQAFSGTGIDHILCFHWSFIHDNTANAVSGPAFWILTGAVFQAWPSQQPNTVPLFQFIDSTDSIYAVGFDAQTPPIVSGFPVGPIVAWVYDNPVCGSVPLMSAVFASKSDHYYTADPEEHAALLALGWTDGGIVAYVLPLPSS